MDKAASNQKQKPTADFTEVYLSELEDIKKRKEESKSSKEIALKALISQKKIGKKNEELEKDIEKLEKDIKTLDAEIQWIQSRRQERIGPEKKEPPGCEKNGDEDRFGFYTVRPSTKPALLGLALSGGGIRSATFNLGLLQAFCNQRVLENVDYLSTVSGGGYIGSCMTTLLNSEGESIGLTTATFPLGRNQIDSTDHPALEKDPVRRLRYFSNYLTAEGGFVSKYLRPAMVFLRGVVLNFFLLIPYLIALSLVLSLIFNFKTIIAGVENNRLFFDMQEFRKSLADTTAADAKAQANLKKYSLIHTADLGIEDGAERIEIARGLFASEEDYTKLNDEIDTAIASLKQEWWAIWIFPAGLFALLIGAALLGRTFYNQPYNKRQIFAKVLAWILFSSLLALAVQLYGILIVYWETWNITAWIASASMFSFVAPKLLQSADATDGKGKKPWLKMVIALGLLALVPLFLLFIVGVGISYATDPSHSIAATITLIIGFLVFAAVNRKFINLNEISLHNFYRDRLSRAYLFKYNPKSQPTTYPCDGIKLHELKPEKGPYHIFNTVLNLSRKMPGTTEVEDKGIYRSGESFVFTRNWCGSAKTGYVKTKQYQDADPHIDVGTAVAISGAAANIGMAHKNIFVLRLLMGLLNIRLGYWALHPEKALKDTTNSITRGFPGSFQALQEWFGFYNLDSHWFGFFKRKSRYINLSDGGHFDNIGVYELLRRRCKYIVVGDAEADAEMKFEAISYIMRLARIDFGIEIEIDTTDIKPDPAAGFSRNHCAVGRIIYPEGDYGYLLYCKASLTGDEPEHLHEYKIKHPQFPHQTTADQWFNEQQFEAYRELGYHIGREALAPLDSTAEFDTEEQFNLLKESWYPHSQAVETQFTQHAVELNKIILEIKNDEDLGFMDAHMYPEWERLIRDPGRPAPSINLWLPTDHKEIRKGFYLCNLMMQLMENVYTDLNLENDYKHPDNRGWMNLFRHWSWSGMFRVSWTISACTFGARFQKFCEKHLDLDLGTLIVDKREDVDVVINNELNPYEQRILLNFKRGNTFLFDAIFVLKLKVTDPLDNNNDRTFQFGFALVNAKNELILFRVQDHLRQMGLGGRALRELSDSHGIDRYSGELVEIINAIEDTDAFQFGEKDLTRFERICNQSGLSKSALEKYRLAS